MYTYIAKITHTYSNPIHFCSHLAFLQLGNNASGRAPAALRGAESPGVV